MPDWYLKYISKPVENKRKELTILIYTIEEGNKEAYKKVLKNVLKQNAQGLYIATEQEKQDFKAVYFTVFP